VLCAGGATNAQEPAPAGIPDLVGARGVAMSAFRGVAAGNDLIFNNPAALAARRRYAIEAQWFLDRVDTTTAFQAFGLSVVDSELGSVAGGFAYTRVPSGQFQGNLFHVAAGFPVAQGFYLGATAKYFSLSSALGERVRAANIDAAAFWQATSVLSIGVTGYNLLNSGHRTSVMPRALGAGVAIGDERKYQVVADWRGDFDRRGKLTNLYAAGAEVLLADLVPLRAGYLRDETRNASFWSAGVGIVTGSGIAVDAAFRQGIDRSDDRTFAVGLKIFVMQ
jgi:hypothetical protein